MNMMVVQGGRGARHGVRDVEDDVGANVWDHSIGRITKWRDRGSVRCWTWLAEVERRAATAARHQNRYGIFG